MEDNDNIWCEKFETLVTDDDCDICDVRVCPHGRKERIRL